MPILSSGSINLLAVNPGLVIWTVVTFSIVMLILWRFAWTPIIEALDSRNTKVEDDLKASESLRKEAEDLLKNYESKMDTAKHEINSLLEQAKKDGEALRNKIVQDAQAEASAVRDRMKNDIEQAKVKAVKEIQQYSVDLSLQLVSGIMEKDMSTGDHRDLVLKELNRLKSDN